MSAAVPLSLSLDDLLYGLRMHESRGDYRARSSASSATGAYQYIRATWAGYRGYPEAAAAPPAVQDERARADLIAAYRRYGSWEAAVAAHFYPAWAGDRSRWNQSPAPGNPTVAAYVASVLGIARQSLALRTGASGPASSFIPSSPALPPPPPGGGSGGGSALLAVVLGAGILLAWT